MKPFKHMLALTAGVFALTSTAHSATLSINLTTGASTVTDEGVISDANNWQDISADTSNINGTGVAIALHGALGNSADTFGSLYDSGLRDSSSANGDTSITLTGLSTFMTNAGASEYDVYVYYRSWVSSSSALTVDLAAAEGGATPSYTTYDAADNNGNDSYILAGNPESNYIKYSGLTNDQLDVFVDRGSRDAMFAGVQIVTVPEPSSAALLGLGGLALILRRRK